MGFGGFRCASVSFCGFQVILVVFGGFLLVFGGFRLVYWGFDRFRCDSLGFAELLWASVGFGRPQ